MDTYKVIVFEPETQTNYGLIDAEIDFSTMTFTMANRIPYAVGIIFIPPSARYSQELECLVKELKEKKEELANNNEFDGSYRTILRSEIAALRERIKPLIPADSERYRKPAILHEMRFYQ